MAKKEKEEAEVSLNISKISKNWSWIVLALILAFGFYIRIYHLDYPVVGYHNWKETHYLTEARNFERYGDWLTPKADFPDIFSNPEGAHGDTLPFPQWVIAAGFMIFGEQLWVARLTSVIFMIAAIFLMYLVMKKLFKREDLALTTALVAATNPLFVFFGRQVQLHNSALFLAMLSIYLYIIWLEKPEEASHRKYLALASIFIVLSFLTEYTFALFMIPIAAVFPYKRLFDMDRLKKEWKTYLYALLPGLLIPLWFLNNLRIARQYPTSLSAAKAIVGDVYYNFGAVFGSKFWDIMKPYAADNYTLIGVLFAVLGLVLFLLLYKSRKKDGNNMGNKFLMWYILGSIPWLLVMASKLSGHSYHQYPIAPLVIILIAFFFTVVASNLEGMIKIKNTKWLFIAGLFLLLVYPPILTFGGGVFEAKDRQFDTQFYGLDIAGQYLHDNSKPDERIFFSGHQSYGFIWNADRKATAGHYNETVTKMAEEKYNYRWVFVYQWGLQIINNPGQWNYIKDNYSLKQIAFQQTAQGPQILYLLLEKGGSFNVTGINDLVKGKQQQTKNYELTKGSVQVVYFDI